MEERKEDDSDVATSANHGVASFSSWSNSICDPETIMTRIRGPENYYLLLKMITVNGLDRLANCNLSPPRASPLGTHMVC